MPELLRIIDPIPPLGVFPTKGEMQCRRTRLSDHYTLLTGHRLKLQLQARTPKEFFEAEAVHEATGKVHWALHARTCVNLRQMLQTDTVEFRHFFMPYTAEELLNTVLWCKLFLEAAFDGSDVEPGELLSNFDFYNRAWPKGLEYDPWLDEGFYFTSPRYHDAAIVPQRIEQWLAREQKAQR
jgi:hypothetical protein